MKATPRKCLRHTIIPLIFLLLCLTFHFVKFPFATKFRAEYHNFEPKQSLLAQEYHPAFPCKQIHGTVAILTAIDFTRAKKMYHNAMQSLHCYAKIRGYKLFYFVEEEANKELEELKIVDKCPAKNLMVKRHCIASQLLNFYKYVIHLDADSGVINPNHCFEEYITPGIDLFLLERVHSGELQAGHYIAKNSSFARDFLTKLYHRANTSMDSDNGVFVEEVYSSLPNSNYDECTKLKKEGKLDYYSWQLCMKKSLKSQKHFGNIKIYPRAHAFVRDGWITEFKWCQQDFLIHAMKRNDDVFFKRFLEESDCTSQGWFLPYKHELHVGTETMRIIWQDIDNKAVNDVRYAVEQPGIGYCWPKCS